MEKVKNRLESPSPLGYSAAGEIIAVDEGNTRFRVGDKVACGGAECAFHAELVAVPDLLASPVPDGVAGCRRLTPRWPPFPCKPSGRPM